MVEIEIKEMVQSIIAKSKFQPVNVAEIHKYYGIFGTIRLKRNSENLNQDLNLISCTLENAKPIL